MNSLGLGNSLLLGGDTAVASAASAGLLVVAVSVLGCVCLVVAVGLSVAASVRDSRERVIPNGCCAGVALCGLVLQLLRAKAPELVFIGRAGLALPSPLACLACAAGLLVLGVAAELLLRRFTGRTGLGLGDVKFVAAWACTLGFYVLPALAAACLLGAVHALARHERTFPMAPWLTLCFTAALGVLALA